MACPKCGCKTVYQFDDEEDPQDDRLQRWPVAYGLLKPDGSIDHELVGTKDDCEYWSRAGVSAEPEGDEEGDLYLRLHSLSKSLEGSGRIDEHDNPDAYATVLDAMDFVRRAEVELVVVPVRLTETQKAKLQRIGVQRLRDWLDRCKE